MQKREYGLGLSQPKSRFNLKIDPMPAYQGKEDLEDEELLRRALGGDEPTGEGEMMPSRQKFGLGMDQPGRNELRYNLGTEDSRNREEPKYKLGIDGLTEFEGRDFDYEKVKPDQTLSTRKYQLGLSPDIRGKDRERFNLGLNEDLQDKTKEDPKFNLGVDLPDELKGKPFDFPESMRQEPEPMLSPRDKLYKDLREKAAAKKEQANLKMQQNEVTEQDTRSLSDNQRMRSVQEGLTNAAHKFMTVGGEHPKSGLGQTLDGFNKADAQDLQGKKERFAEAEKRYATADDEEWNATIRPVDIATREGNMRAQNQVVKLGELNYQNQEALSDPNSEDSIHARAFYKKVFGEEALKTATARQIQGIIPLMEKAAALQTAKMGQNNALAQFEATRKDKMTIAEQQQQMAREKLAQEKENQLNKLLLEREGLGLKGRALTTQEALARAQLDEKRQANQNAHLDRQLKVMQMNNDKASKADDKAAAAAEKKALADAELAVVGWEPTGAVRPKPADVAKARTAQSSLDNLQGQISRMKELVTKYGTTIFTGPESAEAASLASDMRLAYKDIKGLGALTGPDMGILEKLIADPTDFKEAFTSKSAALARLNTLEKGSRVEFNKRMKSLGYVEQGSGGAQATPTGASPGKPKSIMQGGHKYILNEKTGQYE